MSPSALQSLAVIAGLIAGGIFITAFKFALREARTQRQHCFEPEVPRAVLHGARSLSKNRWHRGVNRQRFIHQLHYCQAALVAFGVTSVFLMFLTMAGAVAMMLLCSW